MHQLTRFVLVSSAVCAALFGGCATEEIPQYGDPAKVIGSVGATGAESGAASSSSGSSGSSGSSSGMCPPDAGCTVSFKNDVFPILEMKAKCSDADCHAPAKAQVPVLTPGDSAATLQALLMHKFLDDPPGSSMDDYIVPCDPAASKMMCNLKLDPADGTNSYGKCAPTMPKASTLDSVADAPLSIAELNKIAEWIQCGALDN